MLLMMLEKNMPIDEVVFIDTHKEHPEVYTHIDKVMKYTGLSLTTLDLDYDYYLGEHVKSKGKNAGKRGYGFPDWRSRWCTSYKRDLFLNKYYKGHRKNPDLVEYHGIAYDEQKRAAKNQDRGRVIEYPLIDWGITEAEALQYCYDRGFDWDGLYNIFDHASCWCCPLKKMDEYRKLYKYYPELWSILEDMQRKSFRTFRKDYSVFDLTEKFSNEDLSSL